MRTTSSLLFLSDERQCNQHSCRREAFAVWFKLPRHEERARSRMWSLWRYALFDIPWMSLLLSCPINTANDRGNILGPHVDTQDRNWMAVFNTLSILTSSYFSPTKSIITHRCWRFAPLIITLGQLRALFSNDGKLSTPSVKADGRHTQGLL